MQFLSGDFYPLTSASQKSPHLEPEYTLKQTCSRTAADTRDA